MGRLVNVRLSRHASLVLDGEDICLEDVSLEDSAALVIHACEGAQVRVEGLKITQPGYTLRALEPEEIDADQTPAHLRIRGYQRVDHHPFVYAITDPGEYVIGADGICQEKSSSQPG